MLTDSEITAGSARLQANKLKPTDVSMMASMFERIFAGLQEKYGYDFKGKLAALDDAATDSKDAAQVAAIMTKLEVLGFGVAEIIGGRGGLRYRERTEALELILYAFSKIYPIPAEFASFDLMVASFVGSRPVSQGFSSTREF